MALTKWQPPVLRHSVDDEGQVVWLELYFDLIYVAALIQLGDQLAGDVTFTGVFRFAAVFVVLWWTWTGTTAFMNRFAVDDVWHRLLVFVQMAAVGNLALVAVSPIEDRSMWMVVAYVAARIPLVVMYHRVRHEPASNRLTNFYGRIFIIGGAIWLASLAVPTPYRYGMWAFALAVEFAAPLVATRKMPGVTAHEEHFRERYALFTIIVLGESFVKTLTELADIGVSIETQLLGGMLFAIGIALWWTYFDDVADSTIRPGGSRRLLTWVYAHLPLAAALTALGVAGKKVIAVDGLGADIKDSYLWLLVGAIAVSLLATALLDSVTVSPHFAVSMRLRVVPRVVAAVLVLLVPVVLADGAAWAVVAVVAVITIGQIAVELVVATKAEHRIEREVAEHLTALSGACPRLEEAGPVEPTSHNCPVCEAKGAVPVELRVCLECGAVGCCDDTPGRHARAHFEETGHTLIASLQPGATWAYCYHHDAVKEDWRTSAGAG
ncbi:MAG: low temperature requirement protein A [Actinomycetota bacterium]